jgi:putative endonuclease
MHNQSVGRFGESKAEHFYLDAGYHVLARNWRCSAGELDLIVQRDDEVVFCEVKTRTTNRFGTGFEAVGIKKQQTIRKCALAWLQQSRGPYKQIRFDVASVEAKTGKVSVIEHAF